MVETTVGEHAFCTRVLIRGSQPRVCSTLLKLFASDYGSTSSTVGNAVLILPGSRVRRGSAETAAWAPMKKSGNGCDRTPPRRR